MRVVRSFCGGPLGGGARFASGGDGVGVEGQQERWRLAAKADTGGQGEGAERKQDGRAEVAKMAGHDGHRPHFL
jgi:hypothetical protein